MSNRFFYAAEEHEPYQPLGNVDRETGETISDPDNLKERMGPFFSCDEDDTQPHFHYVNHHPETSQTDGLVMHQMHVPGYDQHDGRTIGSKSGFSNTPPYHIATGWTISDPESKKHVAQFVATKKYSPTTDNDEALDMWKEECQGVFGPGAFETRLKTNAKGPEDIIHEFHPGKEQQEEKAADPEEQEMQMPDMPEMPESEDGEETKTAPSKLGAFELAPGQRAYSIVFHPTKRDGSAFSRTKIYEGHENPFDSADSIAKHADRLDMINTMQQFRKADEDKDIWEQLHKNSKKYATFAENIHIEDNDWYNK